MEEPNQVNQAKPETNDGKTFTFTREELEAHDLNVQESAYRKAAVSTVKNLAVLDDYPISKAMKKISKYATYLIKTYNLEDK
jgi:hypothetical protein